jgi:hypothetical protein
MSQSTTYHDHVASVCMLSTSAAASVSSIAHPLTGGGMLESGTSSGKSLPSIHWSGLPPLGCCPYSSRCVARIHAVGQLVELSSQQTRHRAPLRLRSICPLIGKKGKHDQSLQVPDIKSLRYPIKFSPSKPKQQSTHHNKSNNFSLAEFYYPRPQSIRSYLLQDAIHYPRRSTGFQVHLFPYPPQAAF